MRARLEALPIELLRLIADFISVTNYKGDDGWQEYKEKRRIYRNLYPLACTNRYFNHVFEPYLYQWDLKQGKHRRAVAWGVRELSFGTLERAIAAGFDFSDEEMMIEELWVYPKFPLCRAVFPGCESMVEWLLEHGAKANPPSESKVFTGLPYPAIHIEAAALYHATGDPLNETAAMILLDHGATIFFFSPVGGLPEFIEPGKEHWIRTALHLAAALGWTTVVERILEDVVLHDYVDYRDRDDQTPLSIAAAGCSVRSNAGAMEVLLRHGADPFATFDDVRSPLILAAEQGHKDHIAVLLRYASRDHSKARLFSHQSLWDLMQALDRRIDSFYGPVDCNAILSEFVKFGANFDTPPPPYMGGRTHGESLTLLA
ncbi:hypothetical protein KJ359_004227 [Pestalotiopsis sp. 9143b]|nr:hypothetical protein KJ359_004227 [Pestalotiopsis sp. 9143b]